MLYHSGLTHKVPERNCIVSSEEEGLKDNRALADVRLTHKGSEQCSEMCRPHIFERACDSIIPKGWNEAGTALSSTFR